MMNQQAVDDFEWAEPASDVEADLLDRLESINAVIAELDGTEAESARPIKRPVPPKRKLSAGGRIRRWLRKLEWDPEREKWVDPEKDHDCYRAEHLFGQIAAGTVRPTFLGDFAALEPKRALAVAWITTTCLVRWSLGLRITNQAWAVLLHCHRNTVPRILRELAHQGWIVRKEKFNDHKGTGRNDEKLLHRELTHWFAPGPRLELAWRKFQRLSESTRKRHALPKLAEPILDQATATGSDLASNCDPSALRASPKQCARTPARVPTTLMQSGQPDGADRASKVSPEGTIVERPAEPAANQGKRAISAPTATEATPSGAQLRGLRALPKPPPGKAGPTHPPAPAPSPPVVESVVGAATGDINIGNDAVGRTYSQRAQDIALIEQAVKRIGHDVLDLKDLIRGYDRNPQETMGMVRIFAVEARGR